MDETEFLQDQMDESISLLNQAQRDNQQNAINQLLASTNLANQIQQLETQLTTAKNSYLKVLGAKELNEIQIKEASPAEDATAAVVPEVSGD